MSGFQALLAGFAFYLIIEGLMPFFNPAAFKRFMALSLQVNDQQLRRFGGVMIMLGVAVLYFIK